MAKIEGSRNVARVASVRPARGRESLQSVPVVFREDLPYIPRHTCRTVSPLDAPSSPPLCLLVSCIYTLVRVHCAYSSVVVCDCCSCFWCVDLFPVFPRSLKVFLPLFYFVFLWEFAIRVPLVLATLVTSSDPVQRQFVTSGFMLDLSETVIPASFGTFISPLILVLVMAVASVD